MTRNQGIHFPRPRLRLGNRSHYDPTIANRLAFVIKKKLTHYAPSPVPVRSKEEISQSTPQRDRDTGLIPVEIPVVKEVVPLTPGR